MASSIRGIISDLVKQEGIGPGEEKTELLKIASLIDERVCEAFKKMNPEEGDKPALIAKTIQATPLRPQEGMHWVLHQLNVIQKTPDIDPNKREKLKSAIRELQCWKEKMDSQIKAGMKMPGTLAFYAKCERRLSEIDPDHMIRKEIAQEDAILPKVISYGIQAGVTVGCLYGMYLVQSSVKAYMTNWFGPTVPAAFWIGSQAIGFYQSLRSGNKPGIAISGYFLFSSVYSMLFPATLAASGAPS